MSRTGDRPRSGQSDVLANSRTGDPRSRHANAVGIGEGDISAPLVLENNRLTLALDPKSPLRKTAQGNVTLTLGAGLEVVHGSPPKLQFRGSESVFPGPDGRVRAKVQARDVALLAQEVARVSTPIAAQQAAAAVAAIPAPVPTIAFQTGTVTTGALDTAVAVTFPAAMPNTAYQIFLQALGAAGVLIWPSAKTTAGFTFNLSAASAGTYSYLAIGAP